MPNQIILIITNNALELVKSTFPSGSSHDLNAFPTLKIPFTGFIIDMDVIEMEKIFKFRPDIHNMNAFMAICFPGDMAMLMALLCFRARMAMAFLFSAAVMLLEASSLME